MLDFLSTFPSHAYHIHCRKHKLLPFPSSACDSVTQNKPLPFSILSFLFSVEFCFWCYLLLLPAKVLHPSFTKLPTCQMFLWVIIILILRLIIHYLFIFGTKVSIHGCWLKKTYIGGFGIKKIKGNYTPNDSSSHWSRPLNNKKLKFEHIKSPILAPSIPNDSSFYLSRWQGQLNHLRGPF